MNMHSKLLVFTDLDGTLLDHHTYDWTPALDALDALKAMGAGLILASSKTAVEIDLIRAELQLEMWPAIVENGAGLLPAHHCEVDGNEDYKKLRSVLEGLPKALRVCFNGFGDMSVEQVGEITGLSATNAALAKTRSFSEPGVWDGDALKKQLFIEALENNGVHVQQGGRFMTLSMGANKADQLRALTRLYNPEQTIALGDAPNDIEMLQAADWGVVIANPSAAPLLTLKGEDQGRITRTTESGPRGWNQAILDLLQEHF